jgi:hypothetical protein
MQRITVSQIERLKRQAKVLCRSGGVTHSQALDQLAKTKGWPNWSLLMKHHEAGPGIVVEAAPYVYARTTAQFKDAVRSRRGKSATYAEVADISGHLVSAANAVAFAIAYMEPLIAMPRFKVPNSSFARMEMRSWLPYRIHKMDVEGTQVLVNRQYKPVGRPPGPDRFEDWVAYEAYPQLQLRLQEADIRSVCDPNHAHTGGLFGDGSAPWFSRSNAQDYVTRLEAMQRLLARTH